MNHLPIDEPATVATEIPYKEYEAPAIEIVLTPDELAREVLYAGKVIISIPEG